MATIGERIRARRIALNMTQLELAKYLGYKSSSSINKIEKDGRGLPMKKINQIAEALNTTPDYIMGWNNEQSSQKNKTSQFRIVDTSENKIFKKAVQNLVKCIKLDNSKITEAIFNAVVKLDENEKNRVLGYINAMRDNKQNYHDYVVNIQKRKK